MAKKFLVWSNNDPNDSFEVEVNESEDSNDAAVHALSELGYSISADPINEE